MTETIAATGQAQADSTGTTAAAPGVDSSNSVAQAQTTGNGPVAASEESFFDPSSIRGKPELEQAYKQMQGAWTKSMQKVRSAQDKLSRYEAFERDPMGTLRQVAAQYGVQIVPQDQKQPQDWNPQSWDDVLARAKEDVLKDMAPVFNEVKALKKQNIENMLDTNYPDWRTYEDDMMSLLKKHPSLVEDPGSLYRLAVPSEVIEQRATKTAMQKLKAASEATSVAGSTNGKQVIAEPKISGPDAFTQAADWARKQLAARGMKRPA